jgi:signal transduction histidine kinase
MPLDSTRHFLETFSLRELVAEVCQPLESHLSAQAIQTVIDIPEKQTVTAERELFHRAVRNLVLNAVEAMPDGGLLTATSAAGVQTIELEIADSGPALSDEERQQVFALLPSVQRGGTGWGLAVVHRIAELHGGNVLVANCPDGGVAFTLRLPRAAAVEAAAR